MIEDTYQFNIVNDIQRKNIKIQFLLSVYRILQSEKMYVVKKFLRVVSDIVLRFNIHQDTGSGRNRLFCPSKNIPNMFLSSPTGSFFRVMTLRSVA